MPKANIFVTGIDSVALKCGLALGLASFETYKKKNKSTAKWLSPLNRTATL